MHRLKLLGAALATLALLALPGTALASKRDRDHDGMPNKWEKRYHLNPRKKSDARRDYDRDGLSNLAEYRSRTKPRDADSDNDGVKDGDEDRDRDHVDNANEAVEHTSPTNPDTNHNGRRDGREDADHDHLSNAAEDVTGNDPVDPDTDNDGVKDGYDDANHDGIDDGDEQSGTITSFDGTILTVKLVNGDELKGTVNDGTEIECDDSAQAPTTASTRHDGESESGDDNSGPGSTTSGSGDDNDDQGDDNDDQGENEGNCTKDSLTEGTIVKEAELHITAAGAVFDKIELGGKAPA